MKLTLKMEPAYDNEIHFYDACKAAADKLMELGKKALEDGDCEQFEGTSHEIVEDNDEAETVGMLEVWS